MRGPIATLDPAVGSVPPRLKVFETLHDKYDSRPIPVHHGVSLLLLDYLLITSLLLVTDIQEWMLVKKYEGKNGPLPATLGISGSAPASTSASQWRKIIFGEPLFPRRASSTASSSLSRFSSDAPSPTPTSPDQMAKIIYGEPIYPKTLRTPSPDMSIIGSDSEYESDEDDLQLPIQQRPQSRAPSPSAESVCYPLSNGSAPTHTYLDPMFYNDPDAPPVPPLPSQYASSSSSCVPSPNSTRSSRKLRVLPNPPQRQRSQSTPPRESPLDESAIVEHPASPMNRSESHSPITRSESMSSRRRLPIPPVPSQNASQQSITVNRREKHSSQYSQRSLPPTPISAPTTSPRSHTSPRAHHHLLQYKDSRGDLHWSTSDGPSIPGSRNSLFDMPPPAYNSIDFATGYEMTVTPASPPPLPTGAAPDNT